MILAIPYWHVDAFAVRAFAGNQAAVMLLEDWLDDAALQAIAAENMFAETAFLIPDTSGVADWELRWFTPELEVRLCGHATLASGHAVLTPFWADRLGRESFTAFQASARGGRLTCRREGASAWLGGDCVTVVEGIFRL